MSDIRYKLKLFYEEAGRRRLYRVLVVYLLVGLAALEGMSNLGSALSFPGWTDTLVAVLLLGGFPVALVVGWFYDFTGAGFVKTEPLGTFDNPNRIQASGVLASTVPTRSTQPPVPESAPDPKSIAVLPFVDMSPEQDQEYFGDGIAEEIINALTRIEDLHVSARTSSFAFKGRDLEAGAIGAKLNVGSLLEGSVRKAGDQIRITAQLIDVARGYHLWSESYDRKMEDVFAIQDEVARVIVEILKAKLVSDDDTPIVQPGTEDPEAHNLYLRGLYHWNRRTGPELEKGIELFRQALAIDDKYSLAWAGLADSYNILGWYRHIPSLEAYTKTVTAASSAVAIDDSLAEPYASLAYARFLYGWDWSGAEEGFQAAIERNPNYSVAHHFYAEFLIAMGRVDEAVAQMDIGHTLDPLSPTIGFGVGWMQYFLGNYSAAIDQYEKALEQEADFVLAPWFLGPAFVMSGQHDRAIEVCERWIPVVRRKSGLLALLAYAHAMAGDRDEALRIVQNLENSSEANQVAPDHLALVYIGLGDHDKAFDWLDEALDQRVWYLVYLNADPAFEPLRSDPRFDRLVSKVGLKKIPRPPQ
jgi:TolB-like protein/Tfp pilus assembly protein PilF